MAEDDKRRSTGFPGRPPEPLDITAPENAPKGPPPYPWEQPSLGNQVKAVTDSIPESTKETIRPGSEALGKPRSSPPPPPSVEDVLSDSDLSQYGYRTRSYPETVETMPPTDHKAKRFTLSDLVVLVAFDCIGIPLCIAGAETAVHFDWLPTAVGFGIGIPLTVFGTAFPFIEVGPMKETVRRWFQQRAEFVLPAVILLAFAYVAGPEMYRRATTHAEPPACWDGKKPPCNDEPVKPAFGPFVSPIPPGPIGPFTPSWEDAVNFEQAFFALPRPCLVKIVPNTEEDLHARNVLSAILRMNKACDVIDEQTDQVPKRVDVDAPAPQKFSGLILRWHSDFKEGDRLFSALRGFYNVREGHVMPDNSQGNLILIVIGSGRWHR